MNDETTACIERKRQAIAELQRQIEVMEAFRAGKTILAKPRCQEQDWGVCTNPTWSWETTDYKVHRELRTIYMAQYTSGGIFGSPYATVDGCIRCTGCAPKNVVKFVEVIE